MHPVPKSGSAAASFAIAIVPDVIIREGSTPNPRAHTPQRLLRKMPKRGSRSELYSADAAAGEALATTPSPSATAAATATTSASVSSSAPAASASAVYLVQAAQSDYGGGEYLAGKCFVRAQQRERETRRGDGGNAAVVIATGKLGKSVQHAVPITTASRGPVGTSAELPKSTPASTHSYHHPTSTSGGGGGGSGRYASSYNEEFLSLPTTAAQLSRSLPAAVPNALYSPPQHFVHAQQHQHQHQHQQQQQQQLRKRELSKGDLQPEQQPEQQQQQQQQQPQHEHHQHFYHYQQQQQHQHASPAAHQSTSPRGNTNTNTNHNNNSNSTPSSSGHGHQSHHHDGCVSLVMGHVFVWMRMLLNFVILLAGLVAQVSTSPTTIV